VNVLATETFEQHSNPAAPICCPHDQVPENCSDCAVLEVRDLVRELRPALQAALRNPLIRRWLGL